MLRPIQLVGGVCVCDDEHSVHVVGVASEHVGARYTSSHLGPRVRVGDEALLCHDYGGWSILTNDDHAVVLLFLAAVVDHSRIREQRIARHSELGHVVIKLGVRSAVGRVSERKLYPELVEAVVGFAEHHRQVVCVRPKVGVRHVGRSSVPPVAQSRCRGAIPPRCAFEALSRRDHDAGVEAHRLELNPASWRQAVRLGRGAHVLAKVVLSPE